MTVRDAGPGDGSDEVAAARRRSDLTRLQRELDELLERRDDLAGVSDLADLFRQAARWSA